MLNKWVVVLNPRLAWFGVIVSLATAITFYVESTVQGWPTAVMGLFFGVVAGGFAQLLLTVVLVPVALFFVAGRSWLRWGTWMTGAAAAAAGLLLVIRAISAEYGFLLQGLVTVLLPLSIYGVYRDYKNYYRLSSLVQDAAEHGKLNVIDAAPRSGTNLIEK